MFSLIKSGMASAMHELSVVSNNISNANSIGLKSHWYHFQISVMTLLPKL